MKQMSTLSAPPNEVASTEQKQGAHSIVASGSFWPAKGSFRLGSIAAMLLHAGTVLAADASLPQECMTLIAQAYPDWIAAPVQPEVRAWARKRNRNPVATTGDFNGDGRPDWATIGSTQGHRKLVLCLSHRGGRALAVVDDTGCSDYVYTIRRGTRLPNLEGGTAEELSRDTAATACFEKSGRVFVYEDGTFRIFFHSD